MRSVLALLFAPFLFAQKQPFDAETLLRISRISQPALSPNGRQVAFTVQTIDVQKNNKPQQIYLVPVDGGTPRQITQDGTQNERPRWSPDSRQIYFVSNRGGTSQIWAMDSDGTHARQITHVATEASSPMLTADGKNLLFLSSVYPDCGADDACNKKNLDDEAQSKVKARIYTALLYRHWNEWQTKRRQHVLVTDTSGTGLKDLTPGARECSADDFTRFSRLNRTGLQRKRRSGACRQHQFRYLHRTARRRRRTEDHDGPGRRRSAAVFTRWEIPGVPVADPGGI